jgi:hypothetical protein
MEDAMGRRWVWNRWIEMEMSVVEEEKLVVDEMMKT